MAIFYRCDRCKEEIKSGGVVPSGSYKAGEFMVFVTSVNPAAIPGPAITYGDVAPFAANVFAGKHFCKPCLHDIIDGRTEIVRPYSEAS